MVDSSLESPCRVRFTELLFLSLAVEALPGKMCQNSLRSGGGRSLGAKISRGRGRPPGNMLTPLEKQLIALQLCRWEFLYNETLRQTFRPLLSKLSKRRQILVLYPHFEEVRGDAEPWLMARWKARVEFLLSVIELLTVEALQGKMCQNSLPSGGGRSLGAKISRGRGRTPGNIFIPLERQLIALQLCCWGFYIMKLCSRLFVPYFRSCPKRRQI